MLFRSAYYDDDSPAQKAKVDVVDAKDAVIVTGITDHKGQWSFATPPPGKYEVRVDGGAGHRAKRSLTIPGPMSAEATSAPVAEVTISEGANRAEFTGIPWLKIAIGLVVIGSCTGVFLLVSFFRKPETSAQKPSSRGA